MAIDLKAYQKVKNPASATKKPMAQKEASSWLQKEIPLPGGGFNLKMKAAFYKELGVLLGAGLDLQQALSLISTTRKSKLERSVIKQLHEDLVEGHSFSESLERQKYFSTFEIHSVRIGEETGKLIMVLDEITGFFNESLLYRRQLTSALAYPVFVSLFAVLVVIFLLSFLVPLFSGIYDRFDGELPGITIWIISCSDWMKANLIWVIISTVIMFVLGFVNRSKPWFRKWSAIAILSLPLFGPIIKKVFLARFCRSISLLLGSNVPLLNSLGLVRKMISFYPLEEILATAHSKIYEGWDLHSTFSEFRFFPKSMLALIKVGEESSALDSMFGQLAEQFSSEVEQKTKTIGSLLEPVLIVFLGVFISIVLIAMYMPLFQLGSGFGM
ncbi:MAG: type II secretion system F family protein [Bacteroidota bacterium]